MSRLISLLYHNRHPAGHPCMVLPPDVRTRLPGTRRRATRAHAAKERLNRLYPSILRFLGAHGIMTVPSMAPSWVFLCRHALPVHLSRKLFSDSAGGETFTCRLSPFAGGSSWQRLIALPIAHADPKHRERSAATERGDGSRRRLSRRLTASLARRGLQSTTPGTYLYEPTRVESPRLRPGLCQEH
jgi:hypothetical protein